MHVRAWRIMVGRVPIYLLDTNLEENHPDDRALMNKLYAGGPELRLRQEWILGVGGVRVLRALGIEPAVWHANEGHAAFMMVERLREYVAQGALHRRGGHNWCAPRASSPPTRRCPPGTTRSRSSSRERAPDRSGRRWGSTGTPSSGSARIPTCRTSST